MKRGVQGSRETATADSQQTVAIPASLRELRINITRPNDLTVTGEDRADVAAEMHVTARGFDQAEAKAAADAHKLKVEQVGDALVVTLDSPAARGLPRNSGISQMAIVLKVPEAADAADRAARRADDRQRRSPAPKSWGRAAKRASRASRAASR